MPTKPNDPPTVPPDGRDLSLSMKQVNLMAIPLAVVPAVIIVFLYAAAQGWGGFHAAASIFRAPAALILILVGGIILHELLHAAAWAHYGQKPLSCITFGIHWATLTPYAHCRETLTVEAYRIGAVVPAILLGIIPSALAIFYGVGWLLFPGIIFTAAAGGDMLILWLLRKESAAGLVLDHPTRAGCLVFDPPQPQDRIP
jgi:hypothetical protein